MRLVASILASLGLWLVAAAAAPTTPPVAPDVPQDFVHDALASADALTGPILVAGAVEDWDDDAKPVLGRSEPGTAAQFLRPTATGVCRPLSPPRFVQDRRAATLVGTVVLLI